jgi:glutathione S-transferase
MYILHGINDWGSQVIHMALGVIGAPFRYQRLDFDAGDMDRPEFRALNPFGRIPVLQTPHGAIYETAAILTYLAEQHQGLAPMPGDAGRAEFLTLFTLTTNSLHPWTMFLVHPYRLGGEQTQAAVSGVMKTMLIDLLAHFDREAAKGHWWLSTARPSILSLYVAMLLRWAQLFAAIAEDNIPADVFPNLQALMRATEDHPAIRAVLTAEGLSGPVFSNPT